MKAIYIIFIKVIILGFACKPSSVIKTPQTFITPSNKISLGNKVFSDGQIFISGGVVGHSYWYKFEDSVYQKLVYIHYDEPYQSIVMESGDYKIEKLSLTLQPKVKMQCSIESIIQYIDCDAIGEFSNYFYVSSDTLNHQKIVDLGFLPRITEILSENGRMGFKDPGMPKYFRFQEIIR